MAGPTFGAVSATADNTPIDSNFQDTLNTLGILAAQAGIPKDQIPTAVAIALAESQARLFAHNTNAKTGDDSYGLWQINMIGDLGPARRAQLGLSKNEDLYSPQVNAKAMALISQGGKNWSPWSTYNPHTNDDGSVSPPAYLTYMPDALANTDQATINADLGQAVGLNGGPVDVVTGPGGLASMIKSPLDFLKMLSSGSTWLRVLEVVGGVALIGFALVRLASKTETAQAVMKAAV